jgi:predicted amidohydrolase YtcJ
VLLATPAPFILYGARPPPVLDPDQQVSSTRHFLRELNRFGITSAIDGVGGSQQAGQSAALPAPRSPTLASASASGDEPFSCSAMSGS